MVKFFIDRKKYRDKPDQKYIRINGWCFSDDGSDLEFYTEINGEVREHVYRPIRRQDVQKKYSQYDVPSACGFSVKVFVDKDEDIKSFKFYIIEHGIKNQALSLNSRQITKIYDNSTISYYIDFISTNKDKAFVHGWAATANKDEDVIFKVIQGGNEIEFRKISMARKDVVKADLVSEDQILCGFKIQYEYQKGRNYTLEISDKTDTYNIDLNKIIRKQWFKNKIAVIKYMNFTNLKKILKHISKHGFRGLKKFIVQSINGTGKLYEDWLKENKLSQDELNAQRNEKFGYMPKVSILVPTYNTPQDFFREMVDSVRDQSYSNWELCIADGSGGNAELEKAIKEYAESDSRIRYKILEENLGISGNTNAALEIATGNLIALLDHDDLLAPNALYEVVKGFNEDAEIDVVYTDEDKVDMDSETHFEPYFKSDFNLDLLRSCNYICHFFAVKKTIVDKVGGFRSEFDGSQDYDFIFRCTEQANKVKHVSKMLYHWRMHAGSVAENPENKIYCYEAGKKAIASHLERYGSRGQVEFSVSLGFYDVKYEVDGEPLVSIIIPNKDEHNTLKTCLNSIYQNTSYKNYEVIIVENNSETDEIFEYYKKIEGKNNTKVVYWKDEFNYSAINNFGVKNSSGEYILLLNNDTKVINEDWMELLLGDCQRPEVGITGVKLLYPDDTVQHAGVIVGVGGVAGHAFLDYEGDSPGSFGRAVLKQNVSAVTAACMMVRRSVYDEVGGLEEKLKVAFNDVDFCLKVRERGYLVLFDPKVELYHYESKSRGQENTIKKKERFEGETNYMKSKWKDILSQGDPYYNINLTLIPRYEYNLKQDREYED